MKIIRRWAFGSVAAAVFLLAQQPAQALPPLSRQASGQITAVDPAGQRITFLRERGAGRMVLTWDRRTVLYRGGEQTKPFGVSAGEQARVSYRTPFFGEPYVSRIVIAGSPAK